MAQARKTPAQKATERKISQVGDFKKRLGGIFDLPSGMTVKLRNPGGLRAFMDAGIIPNSLLGIVDNAVSKGQQVTADEVKESSTDLTEMYVLMDGVAIKCIIQPEVHPTPDDGVERDEDTLYVDEIPDEDKMFIFQWVTGGTSDLETFRKQHQQNVVALDASRSTGSNS